MTSEEQARPIRFTVGSDLARQDDFYSQKMMVVRLASKDLHGATSYGFIEPTGLDAHGFDAKPGQSIVWSAASATQEILVGVGDLPLLSRGSLRAAGASASRAAMRCKSIVVDFRPIENWLSGSAGREMPVAGAIDEELASLDLPACVQSFCEGAGLAAYRFDRHRSSRHSSSSLLEEVSFVTQDMANAGEGVRRGAALVQAVWLARDLVNEPAGTLSPRSFAKRAEEVAVANGFEVETLDEAAIADLGLGGLAGVAAGSSQPPRLLKMRYLPANASGPVAKVCLVGKGITFDSGGMSLKTPSAMMTMKTDMSGGAAVLAALSVCRTLSIAVEVIGIVPLTENMPSGSATKPGDVLVTRNGKTIEVLNTDAEGRLVLADGLALAVETSPDAIIDIATLTGACVVALGGSVAGLMSNDSRLVSSVSLAAKRTGEAVWQLPLPEAYRSVLESEVADMRNVGSDTKAGTLIAGLILSEFVGDVPWAHLDIAGPARSESDTGMLHKGGTGFGVRLLMDLLEHWEVLGSNAIGAANT